MHCLSLLTSVILPVVGLNKGLTSRWPLFLCLYWFQAFHCFRLRSLQEWLAKLWRFFLMHCHCIRKAGGLKEAVLDQEANNKHGLFKTSCLADNQENGNKKEIWGMLSSCKCFFIKLLPCTWRNTSVIPVTQYAWRNLSRLLSPLPPTKTKGAGTQEYWFPS